MMSYWNSWQDFIQMGGYAFYVWGASLVFLLVLLLEFSQLQKRARASVRLIQLRNKPGHGVAPRSELAAWEQTQWRFDVWSKQDQADQQDLVADVREEAQLVAHIIHADAAVKGTTS